MSPEGMNPQSDMQRLLFKTAFRRIDVERLLDPAQPSWVRFDPELGYLPADIVMQDGMDGSFSTYTYAPEGNRRLLNHADRPCRINSYGDSFAQCQQVSDGETWQERLAAHLGEPVRNFGVGGYGVYQAWRRARRVEAGPGGAEYVLLCIYDDDHVRNLDACRWIRTFADAPAPPDRPIMIHGLPWAHLRYDLQAGRFVERPGLCATPAEVRALADRERFYRTFRDDVIVRLFVLQSGGEVERLEDIEPLAEAFGVRADLRSPGKRMADAHRLRIEYGLRSSEYILDQMRPWLQSGGKQLMALLCYGEGRIECAIAGEERFDRRFLQCLERHGIPCVDLLEKHAADYRAYRITPREYTERFFINAAGAAVVGHYNPAGNLFCALQIKEALRSWLRPPPPAYGGSQRA